MVCCELVDVPNTCLRKDTYPDTLPESYRSAISSPSSWKNVPLRASSYRRYYKKWRTMNYWRETLSVIIHHCVTCRKMRGRPINQKMADLPKDRLTKSPPFTFVGVDVFGPWTIITRRTGQGSAHSICWAVLFISAERFKSRSLKNWPLLYSLTPWDGSLQCVVQFQNLDQTEEQTL